jgi:isopenicillin N synthase-like dioxygenase
MSPNDTITSAHENNSQNIRLARLPVIELDKLLAGNDSEIANLVDICKSLGFFYLNLNSNSPGRSLLENSRSAFQFMEEYFDQPLETKLQDIRQSVTHG